VLVHMYLHYPCPLLALCLVLLLVSSVAGKQDPKMIKCYHESSGGKFQHCMKDDGFETCFSKFDHNHRLILRGCSSKRKMFHIECESHMSGTRKEQFCYCSYDLCNEGSSGRIEASTLLGLALPLLLMVNIR